MRQSAQGKCWGPVAGSGTSLDVSDYDLQAVKMPTLAGRSLRLFAWLLRAPLIGPLLLRKLVADAGIPLLARAKLKVEPTFRPLVPCAEESPEGESEESTPWEANAIHAPRGPASLLSSRDFREAYLTGKATPSEVAEKLLLAIEASDEGARPLRALIAYAPGEVRRQAAESSARYQAGQPLGPLDGVPVAIKDEFDMLPYPTSVGTSFLGKEGAKTDATVVARLRAGGALLIGKANMYEIGINPESHNRHNGTVRNPYSLDHQSGGSSSGPAAAVAAGLCPLSIGADGGGSIRVPASFCGLVGLKATYGRISEFGAAPLCWSLAHAGPIGATVEDVALAYHVTAGPDPRDSSSLAQPPPRLGGWNCGHLRGVRLGVYRPWFEHAAPDVVSRCDELLEKLRAAGATVSEVKVPGLDLMRVAHAVTILCEMATAMQPYDDQFHKHAPAVQINLLAGRAFSGRDYVLAAQVRTIALQTFKKIFSDVDAMITPTVAITAPPLRKSSLKDGWSDLSTVTEIMRFVVPGNLVGLPAISFPAGYDSEGLPVGMQAMARHWNEALLLRIAHVAELAVERHLPKMHARLLPV